MNPLLHCPKRILTHDDKLHHKESDSLYYSDARITTIKPLSKIQECNIKRTIMIDDTASCFSFNVDNGIQIRAFTNPKTQADDKELILILSILKQLEDMSDVRSCTIPKN